MSKSLPIKLVGATENNLQNISLNLYPGELTVITGLSGTGKSTLLFDVLHAEGQRRYVETFSPYVRQYMESLPRPQVESILNARPSIAVEQKNSIRNSRSTVGTMTELCDYFKVWFSHVCELHDPDDNGKIIKHESPTTQALALIKNFSQQNIVVGFCMTRGNLAPDDFLSFLIQAGHTRILNNGQYVRIETVIGSNWKQSSAFVPVESIKVSQTNQNRISEAITLCLKLGKGVAEVRNVRGKLLSGLHEGYRSRVSGKTYQPLNQNAFSFNSPAGACPICKGFGKVIEIDPKLVVPNPSLSISEGAIKAFEGKVYKHCLDDLVIECKSRGIDLNAPWYELSADQQAYIWDGDPKHTEGDSLWYGISSFFKWLEKKTYKMHVRVFLSKYRGYSKCPDCGGSRFKSHSQLWKWKQRTLPDLYSLPINELLELVNSISLSPFPQADLALGSIKTRLQYLCDVGLGYLSLDRTSRSLSGGETQRINLTTCLGAGLTDTLFALDEPTIGLHYQDVGKLIEILKDLSGNGNIVCVVEHDEQVIRAADRLIELGPRPGPRGGHIIFSGTVAQLQQTKDTPTAKWLAGNYETVKTKPYASIQKPDQFIHIEGATVHNLVNFRTKIPVGKLTCISGLSGSGKSTLLHDVIYKELLNRSPKGWVKSDREFSEVIMIDQSTVAKSPRSNPVLYTDAWNPIKEAFGRTEKAKASGYYATDFSFNSGNGRCDSCNGLGYENIEMQFLPDLSIPCGLCQGKRFKDEILGITVDGLNVHETLELTISEAHSRFSHLPKTYKRLALLEKLGLGYLRLGQPLSTLSGGEAQRLKLAKYMSPNDKNGLSSLIMLDEPTTGLHQSDIQMLLNCLKQVVSNGHTLLVIEHHSSVLLQSDWIIELGPGAGKLGGKITANNHPGTIHKLDTPTGRLFRTFKAKKNSINRKMEKVPKVGKKRYLQKNNIEIIGAQENNLQNINVSIPSNQFVVVTGPSGSGKSSLAFDVVFAEGQRRFMESMSSYARQFIEQLNKPKVDFIKGISPTVAIEQRVTRGSKKSTVGSITEIAQYLRLLYARLGIQCSPINGAPLISSTPQEICRLVSAKIKSRTEAKLLAPLVSNRKGHHKPLINWAREQGFQLVRCDGNIISTNSFEGLDRYRLHDIELVVNQWSKPPTPKELSENIRYALELGRGRCALILPNQNISWFSTNNADPVTGEAYPELEPSLLSWNSVRGWCTYCRGYGRIYDWMKDDLPASGSWWSLESGAICPECAGDRLNPIGRNIFLFSRANQAYSLPQLLSLPPSEIQTFLNNLNIRTPQRKILDSILPEVFERLNFMKNVGLEYLSLNRETASLSGGESQRIRLAAQLGSNLSGVLYVLDEPSIGLHPSDNKKLINSLRSLQRNGNSLLVVEHDQETIRQADCLIEIGPKAGERGGRVMDIGTPAKIAKNKKSSTGIYLSNGISHPLKGSWRKIPRAIREKPHPFIELSKVTFRNLQNISVKFPIGRLIVCCGVSGAGKSSLIRGPLFEGVQKSIKDKKNLIHTDQYTLKNGNFFSKAIEVSQAPIGKTSRSTPATYLGVWTRIRDLISTLPEAKARGLCSSDFSFNVKGGRCETCKGAGKIKLEMNFLPDSYVICDECNGNRFKSEILNLNWHGKNIAEILDMTFEEASVFFSFDEFLSKTFLLMTQTGLGYLRLGQNSPTLSGGEAQRLKLGSELCTGIELKGKRHVLVKKNLYILEEPSIGLHPQDIEKLIYLVHQLVDDGNTVVLIEHDLDLIAEADYLIELGPKGGVEGGKILHHGPVSSLLRKGTGPTVKFLKPVVQL